MLHSVATRLSTLNLLRRALSSAEPVSWSALVDLIRWATIARCDKDTVQSLVSRLSREKQLIFCVSSGRSGTGTLRKIFACLGDIDSYHEPQPNFVRFMRISQMWPRVSYYFLVHSKLPAIDAAPAPIYMETSHLLCKGLLEPMFEVGLRPALIILRRSARDVARSMIRLGTVPGRTITGITWYLHPGDRVELPFPNWRNASDYQLAYWYALEIEHRQDFYAKRGEELGCRVVYANIDDLNDLESILQLWEQLNIIPDNGAIKRVKRIIGKRFNTKHEEGISDPYSEAALECAEAEVLKATGSTKSGVRASCLEPTIV